jgi:hypothetical protein
MKQNKGTLQFDLNQSFFVLLFPRFAFIDGRQVKGIGAKDANEVATSFSLPNRKVFGTGRISRHKMAVDDLWP